MSERTVFPGPLAFSSQQTDGQELLVAHSKINKLIWQASIWDNSGSLQHLVWMNDDDLHEALQMIDDVLEINLLPLMAA